MFFTHQLVNAAFKQIVFFFVIIFFEKKMAERRLLLLSKSRSRENLGNKF